MLRFDVWALLQRSKQMKDFLGKSEKIKAEYSILEELHFDKNTIYLPRQLIGVLFTTAMVGGGWLTQAMADFSLLRF